jgi:hypothetical protein
MIFPSSILDVALLTRDQAFFADEFEILKKPITDQWRNDFLSVMRAPHVTRHFFWVSVMMKVLPDSILRILASDFAGVIELKNARFVPPCQLVNMLTMSRASKQRSKTCCYIRENTGKIQPRHEKNKENVGEELRDSDKIPVADKSLTRLTDESYVALIAGSESPAKIIALILYHLIKMPEV